MAAGTAASRLTGVARILVLAYVLGITHLADGYNLANTTPNMIYDIVLGGVMAATFIPVFVERLATGSEREGWRAISSVVTLAVVVLAGATFVFWFAAPAVIDAFMVFHHTGALQAATVDQERAVATSLLRWFVPQVALYGIISLLGALLNTRRLFVAPMWVPIANNVVVIGVLLWFHHVAGPSPSLAEVALHRGQIVLLGLGTTLGVAAQALLLLPSLRRARAGRLRWRWDPRHEAVRTILRLGGWTFGFVVANQVALYVSLALAVGTGGPAPVSSYSYAYSFLLMPYAVVAVSIMSAVTPDLSEMWSTGAQEDFRVRMAAGLRAMLAVILPAAMGMLVLARPGVSLLLGHGAATIADTKTTGDALAMFAVGLPGFCIFLYVVRVLQAMQRTKVAFWLYLVENGVNVVGALALVHPLGVRGLALSLSLAYSVAAVAGLVVLRSWLGPIGTASFWPILRRVILATLAAGAVMVVVASAIDGTTFGTLAAEVFCTLLAGGTLYLLTARALGRRAARHRPGGPGWPLAR